MSPRKPAQSYRKSAPCKGCTEKFEACHGKCPKDQRGEYGYDAWKAEIAGVKKNRSEFNDMNWRKIWQIKNG